LKGLHCRPSFMEISPIYGETSVTRRRA